MKIQLLSLLFLTCYAFLEAQTEALTEGQLTTEGHFLKAKQAALLGNVEEAIQQFEALAKADPQNSVLFFELGRLYFAEEDFNAAIDKLEKAYDLEAQEYYAYFLAEVYQTAGRNREAAELFGQLVRQQPDEVELYLQQADFYVRAQRLDDALKVYDELERRIGVTAMVSRCKHTLYLGQNDQRKAERELTRLVDAFPQRIDYRHLLAGYYQSQEQSAKAESVYQEILRLEPNDVRAQLALQTTTNTSGSDDELLRLLSRTDVAVDLKIGQLLGLVQEVLAGQDPSKTNRLVRLTEELQRVHTDDAKANALLADSYFLAERYADAATIYGQTVALDEGIYPVWEQYLVALYQDQQLSELRIVAQDAVDIFPNRPRLYVYWSLAEMSRADFGEANSLLSEAQLMSGGQVDIMQEVAAAQQLAEALAGGGATEQPARAAANDPLGQVLSGRYYLQNGDHQAAADLLMAADHERLTNALLLETLADAQAELGQTDAARSNYERARAAGSRSRELAAKVRALSGK
ncbi:MAG: tetratricopeptide repeat protein [Bacteroidota bacterium]